MTDLRTRMIFAALMSFLMTVIMSGWITFLNVGLTTEYAARWGHAFLAAWPAAFFAVMTIAPMVQRASLRLAAALR
ncbi:Protein of unknown function [Duganella sp. CF458]|uniref:DUF2798 domain-containing protein n=1 Tax=Duganella sp. CF458 TaxID=1884368 RepID=UPI0008ED5996|nr:DUF2798 domain-containing protein [Duganella sp. CF458]SFG92473.1 Protein of unknown function [Duganella sp. CF458]